MLKTVMVESDGSSFTTHCFGGIIKHLLVFLAPDIIFTGQLEKDIGLCLCTTQYLSPADQ